MPCWRCRPYKSKLQVTVATSSTEAEFVAAVSAAKTAKYLHSVLSELGFPQSGPTILYEDNQAAIAMVNENKPTTRSRHIDIQYFAIQEWRARGLIKLVYIPTSLNVADQSSVDSIFTGARLRLSLSRSFIMPVGREFDLFHHLVSIYLGSPTLLRGLCFQRF